jgi:serine/threonine protein kinase
MSRERMDMDPDEGPLRIGGQLLKYTIRGLLGRGGYAWVYDGYDSFLDVEVAIKVLHRAGGVTPDMLRRGQAEAKFLYRLRHENVVEVLDAGIADAGLYIVMELLRGPTLRARLVKEGPMPIGDALPFFAQVSDGIGAAHAIKAIHRDVKPENLVILPENRAKVLDFGIVKVIDAVGGTTERDVVHGTVLYLSPEQLNGTTATQRSDVYALGLTLFEALYGKHPLFLNKGRPTQAELPWMQLTVTPPRLDELDARIPRELGRLVQRMLVKDPGHRIASMHEVAEQLRACAARLEPSEVGFVRTVTEPTALPPRLAARKDGLHDAEADKAVTIRRTPKPAVTSGGTERIEPRRLLPGMHVAKLERPGVSAAGQEATSSDLVALGVAPESTDSGKDAPPAPVPARRREIPPAASLRVRATPGTVRPVTTGDNSAPAEAVLELPPGRLLLKWIGICSLAGAAIGGIVLLFVVPRASGRKPEVTIVAVSSAPRGVPSAPVATRAVAIAEREPPAASAPAASIPGPSIAAASDAAVAQTPARPTRRVEAKARTTKSDKFEDRLRWAENDLDKEEKERKKSSSKARGSSPADEPLAPPPAETERPSKTYEAPSLQ